MIIYSNSSSSNDSSDARNDTMKSLIDIHNISTSNRQDATNRRTMKIEPKYFLIGAQKAGITSILSIIIINI